MSKISLLLVLASTCAIAQSTPYALPRDEAQVVLSLDYQGGYTPMRKEARPFFVVRADGAMIVRDVFRQSRDPVVRGRLATGELQALLRFVLKEQAFAAWDAAKVKKAIAARSKAGDGSLHITDASDTVIAVKLPGLEKKAKFRALGFVAPRVPEIVRLRRLEAVRARLHRLASLLRAGGESGLKPRLAALNARLAEVFPEEKPLTSAHLRHARQTKEGTLRISFVRPRSEGKQLYAALAAPEKGKMTIQIQEIDAP